MELNFTIISWILLGTFISSGGIAIYSHLKGYSNHQIYFTLLMLMIAEWSLMSTLESASVTIEAKIFWSKLEYIGAMTSPVFFLRYAIGIAEIRNHWLTKKYWLFWLIPFFVIILTALNELHHLTWVSFKWSEAGKNILSYHHGMVFYAGMAYSLTLVLFAQILIIKALPDLPATFKRQAWSIIIACIFPFTAALIYVTGHTPLEGLNITILSFSISGLVLLFGITRYRMFDIAPFARRRLTEILNDAILLVDKDLKIIYHNPAASKLLQLGLKYFYSDLRKVGWLHDACFSYLENDREDKEILTNTADNEWYNIKIIRILDDRNVFQANLLIITNTSARKKLELQTNRLNEELTISHKRLLAINSQKDKIMSIIGHDLKTPFHQIISLSQILREGIDGFSKKEILALLDDMAHASENGMKTLQDLLNWASGQRENVVVNFRNLHLYPLIDSIIQSLRLSAAAKQLGFVTDIAEDALIFADEKMVTVAFRNLLSNAIKFSRQGGKITITYVKRDEGAQILFTDEGIGIEEKDLKKLFAGGINDSRPGTNGETGSGLGLMLCREMIHNNKGSIEVKSRPGKGTTFTVILPVTSNNVTLESIISN
ncbi:histidine kinase N-terminal 7TM domain-containing protein [Lentimicrobium sp.]|uniref:sensor histidine kinase n=2 Tax=Lentimicrobium sp. TaxID=2034841 RepID=UPI0025E0D9A9|nr:histidine kinase N-terminal 7TM domain-containing protein [Lentimicrobium sp.]MCO5258108.1 ATP-binding protein [Lentimicrobium sp.]HPF64648.1 histidine kinase N-terminal 7TM domain-containing protein [Lentimicrobium sp.]HPJ62882.1 histidine kinase N-terminal 7TM domain-containing protein [Lentimicrobium sp.]HPR26785.1 histidine kinase N-terminal 7TM domain-containing protein [Lentimicrobium sp.]HRW69201.1 histidine kinase N-terminal 7TM domain-containing protein [Lentimicrobium sp.]